MFNIHNFSEKAVKEKYIYAQYLFALFELVKS